MSVQSKLTTKCQITLPKAVRERMGLGPGDEVRFFVHSDGSVVLRPVIPASRLRGIAKREGQGPVSIEQMDEAIAESVAKRYARSAE